LLGHQSFLHVDGKFEHWQYHEELCDEASKFVMRITLDLRSLAQDDNEAC